MRPDGLNGYIGKLKPDFVFLYMVETDKNGGHDMV